MWVVARRARHSHSAETSGARQDTGVENRPVPLGPAPLRRGRFSFTARVMGARVLEAACPWPRASCRPAAARLDDCAGRSVRGGRSSLRADAPDPIRPPRSRRRDPPGRRRSGCKRPTPRGGAPDPARRRCSRRRGRRSSRSCASGESVRSSPGGIGRRRPRAVIRMRWPRTYSTAAIAAPKRSRLLQRSDRVQRGVQESCGSPRSTLALRATLADQASGGAGAARRAGSVGRRRCQSQRPVATIAIAAR